jgi:hypothetical protein
MNSRKYDIAISFLSADLARARELFAALAPRLSVFLYERRQEDIAGTDGMETFRAAFRTESSLNVVLYRTEYGETPWTRVECAAIQDRALNDGWPTVLLIGMESGLKPPKWWPQNRIYASLAEFGVDGVAAIVLARARELDVVEKIETPLELAARLHAVAQDVSRRKDFQESTQGADEVLQEISGLWDSMQSALTEIGPMFPEKHIKMSRDEQRFAVRIVAGGCSVLWRYQYSNRVENAVLIFTVNRGYVHLPKEPSHGMSRGPILVERHFKPTFEAGDRWVWHEINTTKSYSTPDLANELTAAFVRQMLATAA